jgi:hypothetical protein
MKKILILSFLALAAIVSCSKTDDEMDAAGALKVSVEELNVEALGGDNTITVTANCDWTIKTTYKTGGTKWITLSTAKGSSGTQDVTVTVSENTAVSERTATIVVSNATYGTSKKIDATQRSGEPFVRLEKSEETVTSDGGEVEVFVNSNIDYEITISESWASTQVSSGSKGEARYTINVENSPEIEPRSVVVTFSNSKHNVAETLTITQQKLVPSIEVDTESINFPVDKSSQDIIIESTISWLAECDADWVTISPATGKSGISDVKILVTKNANINPREAVVKIGNAQYGVEKQITVSQEAFDVTFNVSIESIAAPAPCTYHSVDIESNLSWRVMCDADWVTTSTVNGEAGASTIEIKIETNTTQTAREAVIKISNADYGVEKQIAVSQLAMPDNVICYVSSDGNIVTPAKGFNIDANIVSNTYENGQGVITFDKPVTNVGEAAFQGRQTLISIAIPDSVTKIGTWAFENCKSLVSVTIPDSVTTIGADNTFKDCKALKSVNIPEGTTNFGSCMFWGCSSLETITLPASLTALGYASIYQCGNLKYVYCKAVTPPSPGAHLLGGCPIVKIYVPRGSVEAYKAAAEWKGFAAKIEGYDF